MVFFQLNFCNLRTDPLKLLFFRHEKVQENCIDLVGRIADRGAEHVGAREWMRICFELLELLKAHKKAIRRATVNTFGYIAKAIGYVTLELCSCTIVLFKAFVVVAVEALLTDALVSGQLDLRLPSQNPVFLNSVVLRSGKRQLQTVWTRFSRPDGVLLRELPLYFSLLPVGKSPN